MTDQEKNKAVAIEYGRKMTGVHQAIRDMLVKFQPRVHTIAREIIDEVVPLFDVACDSHVHALRVARDAIPERLSKAIQEQAAQLYEEYTLMLEKTVRRP